MSASKERFGYRTPSIFAAPKGDPNDDNQSEECDHATWVS